MGATKNVMFKNSAHNFTMGKLTNERNRAKEKQTKVLFSGFNLPPMKKNH